MVGVLNALDPEALRLLEAAKRAYAGGDRPGAAALARQVLLRRPGEATALQILGLVALDQGDPSSARRHLEASQAARPSPSTLNMIGVAAMRLGDGTAARKAFTSAGDQGLADGWRNLAAAEKGAAQLEAYRRLLALAPNDAGAHAGLANAYEIVHELERAKDHANVSLQADPENPIARLALARVLMREQAFEAAEAAASALVQSRRANPEQRVQALGLIGDARDRRDDAAGAFEAFTAANQLSLQLHGAWLKATERLYHPDNVQRMASVAAALDASTWRAPPDGRAPVFLIGFPRSGTTLLDQILSSHSGVVCLEESEHFGDALNEAISGPDDVWRPGELREEALDSIRESYWRRVSAPARALVVDKFLLNIVVLPLIKRVFPNAKIILALRDPRDVVLSCYQQRFGMNAAMAQFLELDRASAYYDRVMTVLEICRERLALGVHEVRYEEVVADIEGATRALCRFLEIGFEPAMLTFQETARRREIATPSARQVVEPLYSRSAGRWRRYERELAPVLPVLAPWAARFGYAT